MALNLLNTATITAKIAGLAVTTSATAIISNSAASGKILKVNALIIANINGTTAATCNVDVYKGGTTAYRIAYLVSVPAGSSFATVDRPIYLEEGDSLRLTASSNSYLEAVCSYEELS